MSSVTRFIKQIPTDSAYFTVWGTTSVYLYNPSSLTTVVDSDFDLSDAAAPVTGTVLRDMGQFYVTVDTGRMFRRVQLLNLASASTEGVVGTVENDYQVYYIEMPQKASLGGANTAGPTTRVARFG